MQTIRFASDAPSADLLPTDELADCAATVLARDGKTVLSYGPAGGYTPLRELIASWFGVHPARVLLTNGWTQAFDLAAANLPAGRSVAIESPADERVMRRLLGSGSPLLYVESDGSGLSTDDLERQVMLQGRPALVYVNPSFTSTTGQTMTVERRLGLVELLANLNRIDAQEILLLEDGSQELTRFEGERLPALFDLSGKRTIYSSSFSATVAPGLRVGWLVLPEDLAQTLTRAAGSTYITPALLGQATVFEFIRRGRFEPHLLRLRAQLAERRDALAAALAEHLPDANWTAPHGGFVFWLALPPEVDGAELLRRAEGVTARAGSAFAAPSNVLRLSYSSTGPEEIAIGIGRLAAALRRQDG